MSKIDSALMNLKLAIDDHYGIKEGLVSIDLSYEAFDLFLYDISNSKYKLSPSSINDLVYMGVKINAKNR